MFDITQVIMLITITILVGLVCFLLMVISIQRSAIEIRNREIQTDAKLFVSYQNLEASLRELSVLDKRHIKHLNEECEVLKNMLIELGVDLSVYENSDNGDGLDA